MMAYKDFRDFLNTLEKEGQLLTISDEVKPEPDLAAANKALSNLGDKTPALFFNNIYGYTDARIAMNVMGSWAQSCPYDGNAKKYAAEGAVF